MSGADGDNDMSVPLFELRCAATDPKQCVLYATRGGIGIESDDEDPWMWLQTCYCCPHKQFTATPYLHTRRKYGPGVRKSGKSCRKLTEFTSTVDCPDDVFLRGLA